MIVGTLLYRVPTKQIYESVFERAVYMITLLSMCNHINLNGTLLKILCLEQR
jgi:hypothetical protein